MDQDVREAFAKLFDLTNDNAKSLSAISSKVDDWGERTRKLEVQVYGSNPPPSLAGKPPAVVTRLSQAEADGDALAGRILAVEGQVAKALGVLNVQSKTMGIPTAPKNEETGATFLEKLHAFLMSREAVYLVMRMATLAAIAWAAFRNPTPLPVQEPPALVTPAPKGSQ